MSPLPLPSVILGVIGQCRRSTVSLLAAAERQGTKNACASWVWIYNRMWQLLVEIAPEPWEFSYLAPSPRKMWLVLLKLIPLRYSGDQFSLHS